MGRIIVRLMPNKVHLCEALLGGLQWRSHYKGRHSSRRPPKGASGVRFAQPLKIDRSVIV